MASLEELELQRIREIQQYIAASLHTDIVSEGQEQDIYLNERLKLILQSKKLWYWRLILEPVNSDFLNLAYMSILQRKPDSQGWNHFHARLAAGTFGRIDVLIELIDSVEFKKNKSGSVVGKKKSLVLLHLLSRRMRKLQLLTIVSRVIWMLLTGFQREVRRDSIREKIQEGLKEVKEREMYLIEYIFNQEKSIQRKIRNTDL